MVYLVDKRGVYKKKFIIRIYIHFKLSAALNYAVLLRISHLWSTGKELYPEEVFTLYQFPDIVPDF